MSEGALRLSPLPAWSLVFRSPDRDELLPCFHSGDYRLWEFWAHPMTARELVLSGLRFQGERWKVEIVDRFPHALLIRAVAP